jgi:hypothetical protein
MLLAGCSHGKPAAGQPATPASTPIDLPTAQVHRIETDMVSGAARRLRRSVELPAGVRLDPQLLASLAKLSIKIDQSTAIVIGENQVQVTADVIATDGTHQEWSVILDQVGGRYVVAGTRAVRP